MKEKKYIKNEDRMIIARLYNTNASKREIVNAIGCTLSTLYRELKRGGVNLKIRGSKYNPYIAQRVTDDGLHRRGRKRKRGGKDNAIHA